MRRRFQREPRRRLHLGSHVNQLLAQKSTNFLQTDWRGIKGVMEILQARNMGFCFGVRRAIVMMDRVADGNKHINSLGAIVHNPQVVERMAERGIDVVEDMEERRSSTVAVTAHGVGPQVMEEIKRLGLEVIDTTCPIVRRSQLAAKRLAEAGFTVVVYGDKNHPEVRGVLGWAGGKGIATTNGDLTSQLGELPRRIGVLAQTTQVPAHFVAFVKDLLDNVMDRVSEVRVINTLCSATSRQQEAALDLAAQVDLMLVIGGRNSANTRHLAEICSETGVETHHIEKAEEVQWDWLNGHWRVGITAGASTPDEAVVAVIECLKELATP